MTGRDLIVVLTQNGTAVAATAINSQEIRTECESMEKASATQQDWTECIAGRKSWSLTVNYLVMTSVKIKDLLKVGQMFGILVKERNDNTNTVSGTALLTGVTNTATVGMLIKASFSFQGSGALT